MSTEQHPIEVPQGVSPQTGIDTSLSTVDMRSLLSTAIERGGTDVADVVERLLGVAERIADREARMSFNRAFARFKALVPVILKDAKAEIEGRSSYSYTYAPLESIQRAVDGPLEKCGLSYRFSNEEADVGDLRYTHVTCTLLHVDGHEEKTSVVMRKGQPNRGMSETQKDAGTLTTACRKALQLALGLTIADDDSDGAPQDPELERLSESQQAAVQEYIDVIPLTDERKRQFLVWANATSVADIAAVDYDRCISRLRDAHRKAQES